jgi:hypothetical protein
MRKSAAAVSDVELHCQQFPGVPSADADWCWTSAAVRPTKFPRAEYVFYLGEGEAFVPHGFRYIDVSVKCEPRAFSFEGEKEF